LWNNFFRKVFEEDLERKGLPEINKKAYGLSKKEIFVEEDKLKNTLGSYDYVYFKDNYVPGELKNYLQMYSLEKTKKEISCCNYNVYSQKLGDFMKFDVVSALRKLEKGDSDKLIDLSQLMVSKKFFLKNLQKLRKMVSGGSVDFINERDTAFVSMSLVQLRNLSRNTKLKLNKFSNADLDKAFQTNFMLRLQTLIYQRKLFSDPYIYHLVLSFLFEGNYFVFRYLLNSAFSKGNWSRVKRIGK
jgi:hypothetical protein